jgi:predicted nucleotidyltransferase
MLAKDAVDSVKKYLARLREAGIDADYAVVYGSQAKGNAGKWSDIDIVVVSKKFDGQYGHEDVEKLWVIAAGVDSRIEPVACGEREWEENDSRMIIEIARREGMKIAA